MKFNPNTPKHDTTDSLVRLQKYIADCGLASRRKAEEMIALGEVTVNGEVITEMGYKVIPGRDSVKVRGKLLRTTGKHVYLELYKPTGVVTTLHDPEGRPTVKDLLTGVRERVFPVGRLDYSDEGLLILTNDGSFAQSVNHPEGELRKVYLVKVKGKPEEEDIVRLKKGVTLAEGRVRALHIERIKSGEQKDWYKVVLNEGRNRQVRRLFEKVGFDVVKVRRVAIGRLTLGKLQRGQFRYITHEQALLALKT